jgi:hypothetical protein
LANRRSRRGRQRDEIQRRIESLSVVADLVRDPRTPALFAWLRENAIEPMPGYPYLFTKEVVAWLESAVAEVERALAVAAWIGDSCVVAWRSRNPNQICVRSEQR